jgi:hypothetical protein
MVATDVYHTVVKAAIFAKSEGYRKIVSIVAQR